MSGSILTLYCITFTVFIFNCFQHSTTQSNETERLALLDIMAKVTDDPLHVLSSWNDTVHFCKWSGVTCDGTYKGVTILDLHSSQLTGTLSPHIGNLSFLMELRLQNNTFGGTIPPEIGRLHGLSFLSLSHNLIAGEIPSNMSSCYNLTTINLHHNNLVGEIPFSFGLLSHLQFLYLSENSLTGSVPSSIGNLSSLSQLFIDTNNFFGSIPETLGNLKNLTTLVVDENKFDGLVPPSIFNLSSLTQLSLRQNSFHGDLPTDLGNNLPLLTSLSMGVNQFSGRIPASLSNASNLEKLQLIENNLQGQVPSLHKLTRLTILTLSINSLGYNQPDDLDFVYSLANATHLQWLQIDNNNFNGVFPQIICNFSALTRLVIHHNNIVGEIPSCLENLSQLQIFSANDNTLNGSLFQSIGKLQNIYHLKLDNNKLTGIIPDSIGNLTLLSQLLLTNNKIKGQIPISLGKCTSLTGLYLSNNNLSGKIPSQLFSSLTLSNINAIDLSRNHLNGFLPDEVGKLENLGILLVDHNMLSGEIPSSLSGCVALEYLYLSKNNFHGTIPTSLQSLKGLLELDLSYNTLTGEIPNFLASLNLRLLNISHNNFNGKVPIDGVFSNATAVLVGGNIGLCGGIPELKLPHCNSTEKGIAMYKKRLRIAILSSVFGAVFLLLVLVLSYISWKRKSIQEPTAFGYLENFPNLSYQTLFKATDGFSSDNMIGSGTYGAVYKGILEEGGSKVAIKVFKLEYHGALKTFDAECAVLRKIRHRNLLKVITTCSSVDNLGREFKALVYEYMVNGSLENWLHPTMKSIEGTSNTSLSLRQRLDIAIDLAFSLEYLHHHCESPIVHCDLKPSNVLLDDEMVAHVGDFGLAKIILEGINTHQSNSIGLRGTIGYTPPEYGLGYDVSTSGDVYSFGILLLEMFTGKRPTSKMFEGGLSLHCFVKEALPLEITRIVDHAILEDIDRTGIEKRVIWEALISILRGALSCSTEVPQERLNMTDVATLLLSIRNNLLTTSLYEYDTV